jgi:hypothetical protein
MTDQLHAIQRAIGYLMDIGGGSIQSSKFTITLNLTQPIVEAPASVAEVPVPIVEAPASVAEVPVPIVEAPASVAEVPVPIVEAPASVAEVPAPIVEALASVAEVPAPIVEALASVAEVPAPIVEAPASVAVYPPLPPPEQLPPLPPLLPFPAPAEKHDVSTMARNLLTNVLGCASIPGPPVGGAGIVPPVLNVRRPAIYDEMEKDPSFFIKNPMTSRSVSGSKRSFQEMSLARMNSDDIIRESPEYKWMIAGFPTKIPDIYNIEMLNYKDEPLFFLKKHRSNKCIYVGFRREAIDKILMDYKLNISNMHNAFHVYLDMIVDNSSDDILKSINNDSIFSSYYEKGVTMNGRIVQYSHHNLLVWRGNKRFRM